MPWKKIVWYGSSDSCQMALPDGLEVQDSYLTTFLAEEGPTPKNWKKLENGQGPFFRSKIKVWQSTPHGYSKIVSQDTCYLLLITYYLLLATSFLLLSTSYLPLATYYFCYCFLLACYLLLVIYYLLFATCYFLFAIWYLLLATCYLLFATWYLLHSIFSFLLATC